MSPFPTLDVACYLHQEESQRKILKPVKEENESVSLMGENSDMTYVECGKYGHTKDKCWRIVGYTAKYPRVQRDRKEESRDFEDNSSGRWNRGGRHSREGLLLMPRLAMQIAVNSSCWEQTTISLTAQQLQQLMKLLPTPSKTSD